MNVPDYATAADCYAAARGDLIGARHFLACAAATLLSRNGRARRAHLLLEAADCFCDAIAWRDAARARRRAGTAP